jgi:hypothetical protein
MSTATKFGPHHDDQSFVEQVVEALAAIPAFFVLLSNACAAARAYERLSHLSDSQLAARGLTREALPQHIHRTYLCN